MASHRQPSITSFFGGQGKEKVVVPTKAQKSFAKQRRKGSTFGQCPLCSNSYPLYKLPQHAASCNGVDSGKTSQTSTFNSSSNKATTSYLEHDREPIPGLFVFENFITEQEEAEILAQLDGTNKDDDDDDDYHSDFLPWKPANFNGPHNGKRWGVHCNLRDRKVSAPEHPLPQFMHSILLPKLQHVRPMVNITPNEANAIDYHRKLGHYLADHVDDRKLSKEPIANLSLTGGCFMTFTNVAPHRNAAVATARVWLPPRCLQVLTGRARYDFSHGIRNADLCDDRRISVTMRESPLTESFHNNNNNVSDAIKKVQANGPASIMPVLHPPKPPAITPSPKNNNNRLDSIQPSHEPIPGLFVFEDFITIEEEEQILLELNRREDNHGNTYPNWRLEKHSGWHLEKRWGIEHDLWSQHLRPPQRELPGFMKQIILPKLRRVAAMQGCIPTEINAIDYRRKQGHSLQDHVDDRRKSKEPIANLSLAGDCYMTYKLEKPKTATLAASSCLTVARSGLPPRQEEHKVLLKRRCLQILSGKARYDYTHGIANHDLLSDRRVSVTMRDIPFL